MHKNAEISRRLLFLIISVCSNFLVLIIKTQIRLESNFWKPKFVPSSILFRPLDKGLRTKLTSSEQALEPNALEDVNLV